MRSTRFVIGTITACASGVLLSAQIFFNDTVAITFAPGKVPAEAAWSDQMELTPTGLATLQPWRPNTSRDFWFRTQPLATGPSWRPPTNLKVTVALVGVETAGAPSNTYVRAYVRHSFDRVHWSSWAALSPSMSGQSMPTAFDVQLSLPRAARARYAELMQEWWQSSPVWSSDEHEFALWLAARHRDVFDAEIPAIGYAQVLIEGGAQGLRVGGLSVTLSASGSGLAAVLRGERRKSAEEPWFFDLSKIK